MLILIFFLMRVRSLEITNSLVDIITLEDGSQVLQKPSQLYQLAFEHVRAKWMICENPFDCTIYLSMNVWPKEILVKLTSNLQILGGSATFHGPNDIFAMFSIVITIDKEEWLKKPEPIHWRDAPPVFWFPQMEFELPIILNKSQ